MLLQSLGDVVEFLRTDGRPFDLPVEELERGTRISTALTAVMRKLDPATPVPEPDAIIQALRTNQEQVQQLRTEIATVRQELRALRAQITAS